MPVPPQPIANPIAKKAIFDVLASFKDDDYKQEGIFRVSVDKNNLDTNVKNLLDPLTSNASAAKADNQPHLKACALKKLLRDSPALFDETCSKAIIQARDEQAIKERIAKIGDALNKLPPADKLILSQLLDVCGKTTAEKEINKMTAKNIAVTLAQNLFTHDPAPMQQIKDANEQVKDITFIIENRQALQVLMKIQELDPKQIKDQVNSAATQEKTAVVEKNNKFKIFIVAGVATEINRHKYHSNIKLPEHYDEILKLCEDSKREPANIDKNIDEINQIMKTATNPEPKLQKTSAFQKLCNLFSRKKNTNTKILDNFTKKTFSDLKTKYQQLKDDKLQEPEADPQENDTPPSNP